MAKDKYKILNVKKDATHDEIKKAYRLLARKYHPDLNPNNKSSEEKFREVSEAYETLSNKESRAAYDAGEHDQKLSGFGQGPFYTHTQSGDSSRYRDIFNESFGGFNFEDLIREQARRQRDQPQRGNDLLFQMEVDFKDAMLGADQIFALPDQSKISAKIPAGIKTGQKIKLTGRGEPGRNGGPNGDLFIEVQVRPSKQFKRVGNDLESEVDVLFSKAILGGKIQVPTLDGSVEITLPPKVSTGTRLRIKGKGITSGKVNGDLYALIKITIPKEISPELQAAVKKWDESIKAQTERGASEKN